MLFDVWDEKFRETGKEGAGKEIKTQHRQLVLNESKNSLVYISFVVGSVYSSLLSFFCLFVCFFPFLLL